MTPCGRVGYLILCLIDQQVFQRPCCNVLGPGDVLQQDYAALRDRLRQRNLADFTTGNSWRCQRLKLRPAQDLILRVTLALVLSRTALGSTGIWRAWPIGWTAAAALSVGFYRTGRGAFHRTARSDRPANYGEFEYDELEELPERIPWDARDIMQDNEMLSLHGECVE